VRKVGGIILTVVIVYVGCQLTIGDMMKARIDDFSAQLEAAKPSADGTRGPIALRSSDICTMLTQTGGFSGTLSRLAFPAPGAAADRLTARYRFVSQNGCSKYNRRNLILAKPLDGSSAS
jgi:hypothetical protein